MSDEDHDVDIESDDDDDRSSMSGANQFMTQAEKRAHHNALERKRRDHIKESFHGLRDSVPSLQGEKVSASRAQILKQATDYIQFMSKKNNTHQVDIDDLRKQNGFLEQQVRALEKAKTAGTYVAQSAVKLEGKSRGKGSASAISSYEEGSGSESSDSETHGKTKRKKLKTSVK